MASNRKGKTLVQFDIEIRQKENKCVHLVREGMDYASIAHEVGYETEAGARLAVKRALKRHAEPDVEALREIEGKYLRDLAHRIVEKLEQEHVVVQWGKVVIDPRTNEPLVDDAFYLACIKELRMISERYSKLRGLDAPLKTVVEEITNDMVDREIKRIEAMAEAVERDVAESEAKRAEDKT